MFAVWPRFIGFQRGGLGDLFKWIVDYGHTYDLETFVLHLFEFIDRKKSGSFSK